MKLQPLSEKEKRKMGFTGISSGKVYISLKINKYKTCRTTVLSALLSRTSYKKSISKFSFIRNAAYSLEYAINLQLVSHGIVQFYKQSFY